MPFENENDEVAVDGQDENLSGGMQASGFSSSKDAVNPYTTQLNDLLSKYLKQSEKSATDKQARLARTALRWPFAWLQLLVSPQKQVALARPLETWPRLRVKPFLSDANPSKN